MKNTYIWLITGLLGIVIGGSLIFFFQRQKTGYINTAVLMEKATVIAHIKSEVKIEVDKAKSNIDTLQQEFENQMKVYERNLSAMTTKEKELSQQLLNVKRQELIRYQQAVEEKLSGEEQKKTGEALKAINGYISEYGKEKGYTIIFATVNGNIAYADEAIDITEEIIKGVNEKVR